MPAGSLVWRARHVDTVRTRVCAMSHCACVCINWRNKRPRFGSPRLHALIRREGLVVNHKRTERIYRQEGLTLKRRRRRRLVRIGKGPRDAPRRMNEPWSLDFVNDAAANGQTIRVLTVVDDY